MKNMMQIYAKHSSRMSRLDIASLIRAAFILTLDKLAPSFLPSTVDSSIIRNFIRLTQLAAVRANASTLHPQWRVAFMATSPARVRIDAVRTLDSPVLNDEDVPVLDFSLPTVYQPGSSNVLTEEEYLQLFRYVIANFLPPEITGVICPTHVSEVILTPAIVSSSGGLGYSNMTLYDEENEVNFIQPGGSMQILSGEGPRRSQDYLGGMYIVRNTAANPPFEGTGVFVSGMLGINIQIGSLIYKPTITMMHKVEAVLGTSYSRLSVPSGAPAWQEGNSIQMVISYPILPPDYRHSFVPVAATFSP